MDFQTLTRRQLQTLCKKNKIAANLTNVAMADSLKALDIVEGIEEVLIGLSEQSNLETPIAPRTGCRSSARRIPIKEDAISTQIMTRTRRGAKIVAGDDKENPTLDVPETPAGKSCRKRVPIAPVRPNTEKQLDIEMELEKKEQSSQGEEKKGVPKTPMEATAHPLTRTTRSSARMTMKSGNQVETSTKKVYSTRRNTRLLEKKMMELSLIGDDDEIESAKIPVASGDVVQLLDEEGTESHPIDEDVPSKVETLVVPSEGAEELEEDSKESTGDEDILSKIQISEASSSHILDVQYGESEKVQDDVQEIEKTEENVHVSEIESYDEVSDYSLNVEPYFEGLEKDIQESKGDEGILSKTLKSEASIQVTDVQLEEIEGVKETEEDVHVSVMENYEVSDQTLNVDPDCEEFREDIQESKEDEDIVSKTLDVQSEEIEEVEDDVQDIQEIEEVDDDVQDIEETDVAVQDIEENEVVEDYVQEIEETEEVKDGVQKVKETEAVEEVHVQEVKETEVVEDDVQQEIEIEDVVQEVEDDVQQEIEKTEEVEDDVQKAKETEEVKDDVQKEIEDDAQKEIEHVVEEVEEIEEDFNVSEMESYEIFDQTLNAEPDVKESKDNVLQDGTNEVVEDLQESKEDLVSKTENSYVSSQNSNVHADGVEEVEDNVECNKPREIETDKITEEGNKDDDESKTNEGFHVSMTQLEDKFDKVLQLNDEVIEKGFDDLVTVERDDETMIDNGSSFKNQIEKMLSKSLPLVSSHLTAAGLVASVVSPFKKPAAISGHDSFQILDVNEEEKKNENKNGLDLTTTEEEEEVVVKKNEAVMGKDYSILSLRQLKKEFKQKKKNVASEQQDVNATRPALQVLSENQVVKE